MPANIPAFVGAAHLIWLGRQALAAARPGQRNASGANRDTLDPPAGRPGIRRLMDCVTGGVLIAFGLRVAIEGR